MQFVFLKDISVQLQVPERNSRVQVRTECVRPVSERLHSSKLRAGDFIDVGRSGEGGVVQPWR